MREIRADVEPRLRRSREAEDRGKRRNPDGGPAPVRSGAGRRLGRYLKALRLVGIVAHGLYQRLSAAARRQLNRIGERSTCRYPVG